MRKNAGGAHEIRPEALSGMPPFLEISLVFCLSLVSGPVRSPLGDFQGKITNLRISRPRMAI
jgi:hypothetical protein